MGKLNKKFIKNIVFLFISIFIGLISLSSIEVRGAILWPTTVPTGEYTGGLFYQYFNNILGNSCPNGSKLLGYNHIGEKICDIDIDINGVCGINKNCISGFKIDIDLKGEDGDYNRFCLGKNNGLSNNCKSTSIINGGCGLLNNMDTTDKPYGDQLCYSGISSEVKLEYNTWSWTCTGNGGTNASCSANKKTNGFCGTADGTKTENKPTTNLCFVGTDSAVSGNGPWSWVCTGMNGGTTATCSATKNVSPTPTPLVIENGKCGGENRSINKTNLAIGDDLCDNGNVNGFKSTNTGWSWTCDSINGGTNVNCSATKLSPTPTPLVIENGKCGGENRSINKTNLAIGDDLCNNGNVYGFKSTSTGWSWVCTGMNGGNNVNCSATKYVYVPPLTFEKNCTKKDEIIKLNGDGEYLSKMEPDFTVVGNTITNEKFVIYCTALKKGLLIRKDKTGYYNPYDISDILYQYPSGNISLSFYNVNFPRVLFNELSKSIINDFKRYNIDLVANGKSYVESKCGEGYSFLNYNLLYDLGIRAYLISSERMTFMFGDTIKNIDTTDVYEIDMANDAFMVGFLHDNSHFGVDSVPYDVLYKNKDNEACTDKYPYDRDFFATFLFKDNYNEFAIRVLNNSSSNGFCNRKYKTLCIKDLTK